MKQDVINPDFTRDIQESDIPADVLNVLLVDRIGVSVKRTLLDRGESLFGIRIWSQDGY